MIFLLVFMYEHKAKTKTDPDASERRGDSAVDTRTGADCSSLLCYLLQL